MLLSEEFVKKAGRISRFWLVVLMLECTVGFVFAIIAAAWKPQSSTGLFEYLSGIKGVPNENGAGAYVLAGIGFPFYLILNGASFFLALSMVRDTFELHKGKNGDRIAHLRKQLLWIMALTVISVFALIVHGAVWWIVCAAILILKWCYVKEVRRLNVDDIGKNIELLGRRVKRDLSEKVYSMIATSHKGEGV